MRHRHPAVHGAAPLLLLLGILGLLAAGETLAAPGAGSTEAAPADTPAAAQADAPLRKYTTETLRGRVVWLDEALKRLYGVATEPSAAGTTVALETPEGRLLPIIPDTRGRAFAIDERLRNIDLELPVRRYQGVPMIQIIRVLRPKPDGLYEIDYWCDVCAIPMFLLKPCECCQGPTRLREQKLEGGTAAPGR